MEMIDSDVFNLANISDVKLVNEYIKTLNDLKNLKHKKYSLEQKAKYLMTDRGSTVIQGDTQELIQQTRPVYDKDRLTPLKEKLNIEDLIRRGAYIPEKTEVVKEDWNMTNLKPFMAYGEDVKKVIENSIVDHSSKWGLRKRR
tara:strand:+ start:3266 stop:3694 length:429 start_codon:yes stop_codon:yes gene_type:complete